MSNKKRFGILLLTGTLLMGTCTTAFAGETGSVPTIDQKTEGTITSVTISKNLKLAEGLSVPDATFQFTATPGTPDTPEITIPPVTYQKVTDQKTPASSGITEILKKTSLFFPSYRKAGVYTYTIKETDDRAEGITYSADQYILRVQVADKNGQFSIQSVTAEKNSSSGDSSNKVSEILFTNVYRKNSSLMIQKKVTGDSAETNKDFDFTITLKKSPTETESAPVYSGHIGTEDIQVQAGTPYPFQLHGDEILEFPFLPVGTKCEVTEIGAKDSYTPSVQIIENGKERPSVSGKDEENLSTGSVCIGENKNEIIFTNHYNTVPLTGIIMNYLPYLFFILLAVLALVSLVLLKRHKSADKK